MKAPATADVAVSKAAVDNAAGAGGTEFAPMEMSAAREKLVLANAAMKAKDYKLASDLANQAQVDAKLAQSKANSAKAQTPAKAHSYSLASAASFLASRSPPAGVAAWSRMPIPDGSQGSAPGIAWLRDFAAPMPFERRRQRLAAATKPRASQNFAPRCAA